jgi:hypothetical protein
MLVYYERRTVCSSIARFQTSHCMFIYSNLKIYRVLMYIKKKHKIFEHEDSKLIHFESFQSFFNWMDYFEINPRARSFVGIEQ